MDHEEKNGSSGGKDGKAPVELGPSAGEWKKDLAKILVSRQAGITIGVLLAVVGLRMGVNWLLERKGGVQVAMVKVAGLQPKNMDKTLTLPGNVEAIEQATIYAHVSGYLKKILVDEGDRVKKNQLLAVIDAPDIEQEFRNAKADYDFRETTRKRYEQLVKEKVVSQQEYDKVDAEANQAKARYDNARSNVDYTQVRAAFAGGIARRFKYPGDFISAPTKGGAPSALFLLVNEERLRIVVNVPQKEVSSMSLGQEVDIHVDTFPDQKFAGTASRIDALLDEATKTQRVLIDIDNPDTKLRAGMFASVVMHIERKDNLPMVTKDAVHEDGKKSFVFVVRDGKVKKLPVTVGDTEGGFVEVSAPDLDASAQIIVSGGDALTDGDAVKVTEEPARKPQQEATHGVPEEPRKIANEGKK